MEREATLSRSAASREELGRRYSRQIILPEVGIQGQELLSQARVLCIGAGGLGSGSLPYLVGAGIGRIGIADFDVVELSNCHRQVLFSENDVGRKKSEAARDRLSAMNGSVAIDAIQVRLDASNAREIVRLYDVAIDGSDNLRTRYVLNDACYLEKRPLIYGAISRFEGQVSVFAREKGPCYRCLFPEPPGLGSLPNCSEAGVLGVLPGIIGAMQANEALKCILGIGAPLYGTVATFDALTGSSMSFTLARDAKCRLCGDAPSVRDVEGGDEPTECATREARVDGAELFEFLEKHPSVCVLDIRERGELREPLRNTLHIPATELRSRINELNRRDFYLVGCSVGVQSLWAIARLREAGFEHVIHLEGGFNRAAYSATFGDF